MEQVKCGFCHKLKSVLETNLVYFLTGCGVDYGCNDCVRTNPKIHKINKINKAESNIYYFQERNE
jgi:hypothetical protein